MRTSQHLFDLSASLSGGKLVDDVQRRLAVRVPHRRINATLQKKQNMTS